MYEYFKQFGEIKSTLHFGRYGKENYVLVEFACKEVAAQMAMRRGFIINGQKFKVESVEKSDTLIYDLNLESAEMSKPPSKDSPKNILNVLNDDCIGLIFEKISNIRDFHSISKVCVRFAQIAGKIFPSKIKRRCVDFREYRTFNYEDLQMIQIENFLRDFGSSIESLEISECYIQEAEGKSNTLLKIIHEYCKNLRKLDLHISGVDNQTVSEIQPLLSKLEYLYLGFVCGSDFGPFNDFISACTQLNTLILTGCQSSDEFSMPNLNFPNLRNFQINSANIAIDSFLECNPQIETITVKHPSNVRSFFNHDMPNIQELSLLNPNVCITQEQSSHLRSLKVARLHLEISLDDSIINIFHLKNIVDLTLHVKTPLNEDHLVSLVRNLSSLEKMSIYHDTTYQINFDTIKQMLQHTNQLSFLLIIWPTNAIQPFDKNDYNEMLKFVKNRSKYTLNLKFINQTTLFDDTNGLKKKFVLFNEDSQRLRVSNYFEYAYW